MNEIIEEVKQKFSKYLEENNNRKTHERFAILEEIYENQKHFDAETLYVHMKKNSYRVSRATVYNTIDVLLECKLIQKHQFGNNVALFEKTYGVPLHHHIICSNCEKIIEFQNENIKSISHEISTKEEFELEKISLNLYGCCKDCSTS